MERSYPWGEPRDDDEPDAERMAQLEHCPEVCPACGSDDLHSALLGGEEAISCCDCVWAAIIASFQPSGGEKP
jgi:hypothetical protein